MAASAMIARYFMIVGFPSFLSGLLWWADDGGSHFHDNDNFAGTRSSSFNFDFAAD
jgi:hypothetical protein